MSEEEVEELFKSTIDTGNNEVDYRGMCRNVAVVELGILANVWLQNSSRPSLRTS